MEGNKQGGPQPHEEAVAQLSAESRALEVQEEATGTSMHQPDLWVTDMTAQILALWENCYGHGTQARSNQYS